MPIAKPGRRGIWAAALLAIAIAALSLLMVNDSAHAHQPDGLRMSPAEAPDPPCPYGHDAGCENATPPLTAANPYLSASPDALLPYAGANPNPAAPPDAIAYLRRQLHSAPPTAALTVPGDAPGDEPGAAGNGANYAYTSEIAGLPWARDGQTASERLTLGWLSLLQDYHPTLASALTRMPFLQDHTPGDRQAIATLASIAYRSPDDASAIVNSRSFADGGGLDNNEAKIVAVMGLPYSAGNTTLLAWLPEYGVLEEQSTVGQYGNPRHFAIVRVAASRQNSALMQAATSAATHTETLMGQALPTDFVGILVADGTGVGASNSISIRVDAALDRTSYSGRARQHVVAHEIGHYWWHSNYDHDHWLSEGAADYIGAYSVWSRFADNDVSVSNWPCPYYRTIEHLRADAPQYGSFGSTCNYSLGEKLFISLDRSMTTPAFNAAFRSLHRLVSTYRQDGVDQGLSLMRAFCPECSGSLRNLGNIGNTLARRYGEKILTDSSPAVGAVPGLGRATSAALVDYSIANRQYGIPQVPASSPDQRRWVRINFSGVNNPPAKARIIVQQYHEDREPYAVWLQERTVYSRNGQAWFHAYLGQPNRRAAGHHWVYIYNENRQKIAAVEYQVLP